MSLANSFNPFVGLRPFESDESLLFFGRQEQTLELLQRLHQHHFVAVVGSSGSGKSSLIRAGLIPALKAGYLVDDRDRWMITIMKPGQSPIYNLADAIINQANSGNEASSVTDLLKRIKEEGSDAILDTLKPLWEKHKTNFFLLVDQFEELFRFSMDQKEVAKKDEAIDFVNIMLELSRQTDLPVYVVITMRSDFIGDCSHFYGLPEAMNQSQYLVPRLNRVQLKNVIEGPVKLYGGNISPILVSRLLNDIGTTKDELPLLQHALMRIWDHEMNVDKNGELDLKDYEKIGGIEKALSNHADEALQGMSEEELMLTKKIFQALTAIDENGRKIRRPVRISDLKVITGASAGQLQKIINRFIEGKKSFLVINKVGGQDDEVVDISHESLIRQWIVLSGWVDEEAESSKNYLRLVESANLYRNNKKNFITGIELQLALQWFKEFRPVPVWAKRYHKDFEESMLYLQGSEKEWEMAEHKKKTGRKKRVLVIIGGTALVFVALAFNNIKQTRLRDEAEIQKSIAIKEKEKADRSTSVALQEKGNADRSAQVANLARIEAEIQKRKADSSAIVANKQARIAEIAQHEAETQKFLAEKNAAIAKTQAQLAKSALLEAEVQRLRATETGQAYRLIILAQQTIYENPTVALRLAEAAMEKEPDDLIVNETKKIFAENFFYKIIKDSASFLSSARSPDGTQILTGGYDNIAKLWKMDGSLIKELRGNRYPVMSVAFSADGKKILTGGYDHIARLYNEKDSLIKEFKGNQGTIFSVAFSPDGKNIVTGSKSGLATLYNAEGADEAPIKVFKGDIGNISSVAFSQDGKKILTSSDQKSLLWDINGSQPRDFEVRVSAITFSRSGETILIGVKNDTTGLFNLNGDLLTEFGANTGKILSVAFSLDGRNIVTGSEDGIARLWTEYDNEPIEFKGHTGPILSVAFSTDGVTFFTWSKDQTVRSWKMNQGLLSEFKLQNKEEPITDLLFSQDRQKILTVGEDQTVGLWNVDGTPIQQFKSKADEIVSIKLSPDGKKILTSHKDSTILLWKTDGTRIKQFPGSSFAFSPDGKTFLTGAENGIIKLWNADGTPVKEYLEQNKVAISCVAFSPDGKTFLTGSKDQSVSLWNLYEGFLWKRKVEFPPTNVEADGVITSIIFTPEKTIVIGARIPHSRGFFDKSVLLNMEGVEIDESPHIGQAFSPDGKQILNWYRSTCTLYKADGTLLWEFKVEELISATFSADGSTIITGSIDGVVRRWNPQMTLMEFLKSDQIERLSEKQQIEFGIK